MAQEPIKYIHDGMELPVEDWNKANYSFDDLAGVIRNTHDAAQTSAVKAIIVCRRCATGLSAITL